MVINLNVKCSDECNLVGPGLDYYGYVPDFFPGDHCGDYIEFKIDTATGQILNWPKGLTDKKILNDSLIKENNQAKPEPKKNNAKHGT